MKTEIHATDHSFKINRGAGQGYSTVCGVII
jgi:hypothetical protein